MESVVKNLNVRFLILVMIIWNGFGMNHFENDADWISLQTSIRHLYLYSNLVDNSSSTEFKTSQRNAENFQETQGIHPIWNDFPDLGGVKIICSYQSLSNPLLIQLDRTTALYENQFNDLVMQDEEKAQKLFQEAYNRGVLDDEVIPNIFRRSLTVYWDQKTRNDEWNSLCLVHRVLEYKKLGWSPLKLNQKTMSWLLGDFIIQNTKNIRNDHRSLRALLIKSCILNQHGVDIPLLLQSIFLDHSYIVSPENILRAFKIVTGDIVNPFCCDRQIALEIQSYYQLHCDPRWESIYDPSYRKYLKEIQRYYRTPGATEWIKTYHASLSTIQKHYHANHSHFWIVRYKSYLEKHGNKPPVESI
jgi:hypothetical protein